ncbi:MAG: hypothetical protein LLG01_00810 [Planctomycetaceae bacterium]|nr:hypothetical protein [Planctomycetaceae bacterium]
MFSRQSDESRHDDERARAATLRQPEVECQGCGGEAVDTGKMFMLCDTCVEHLAEYDMLALDMRQAALKLWKILHESGKKIDRSRVAAVFHLHLAGYLPTEQRERYHEDVASKVTDGLLRGNERAECAA